MTEQTATFTECPWCEGAGCLVCARTTDYAAKRARRREIVLTLTEIEVLAKEVAGYADNLDAGQLRAIRDAREALTVVADDVGTCPECGRERIS